MVWLSRRLCGLDDVIEYRGVVSNFAINDCCGGKHEKRRKERTRAGLYYEGSGRSDVAEKDSTCTARRVRGGSGGEGPFKAEVT